jgi:hypothetical protein
LEHLLTVHFLILLHCAPPCRLLGFVNPF